MEGGRLAASWVRLVAAQRALTALRRERDEGRGRRPNLRALERLSRRVGLEDATYAATLDKLQVLASRPAAGRGATAVLDGYRA